MRKTRHLSLSDCYAILQLPRDASLDDVKKAYRRRAFELHPDLNPDTPHAGHQFQDLNEAYVSLVRVLEDEEVRRKAAAEAEAKRQQERAQREAERKAAESARIAAKEAAKEAERKAAEAEKLRQREAREKVRQEKEKERQEKEREKQEQARQRAEAKARAEAEAKARAEAEAKARAEAKAEQDWQKEREAYAEKIHADRQRASKAYAQEDVLRDLLDDPFARRVFEDIYSAVNKQGDQETSAAKEKAQPEQRGQSEPEPKEHSATQKKTQPKPAPSTSKAETIATPPTAEVTLSDSKGALHMANSFSGKIMGWFKHQIDDEQTIKMAASALFVGARIRLQIRRGLSEELSTVEITLPKDFVVGKAIRLKGLGKKVGKWQGDLYLTIESK